MKKILISSLILGILVFPVGQVSAQAEPATQSQVQDLQTTLVALLTQLIAQLQAQITELLTQQATQATKLGAVQEQVQAVVEQTKPVVDVQPSVTASISIGDLVCYERSGGYKVDNSNVFYNRLGRVDISVSAPVAVTRLEATMENYRIGAEQNNVSLIYVSEGLKTTTSSLNLSRPDLVLVVPGTYHVELKAYNGANVIGSTSRDIVFSDCSTPMKPATLGTIYKSADPAITKDNSGETWNIIPLIFNGAYRVSGLIECPNAEKVGHIVRNEVSVKSSDHSNGYTFKRRNMGACTYSLQSWDRFNRDIGETVTGNFELNP